MPFPGSAPEASRTIQPVSLLPFTPHDFAEDSVLFCFSSSNDTVLEKLENALPHGREIMSKIRKIGRDLLSTDFRVTCILRTEALDVQFMKGMCSRL